MMDSPTIPLQTIMMAANTVSRASVDALGPSASIKVMMSETSIAVTAIARTSVPNGSPTRCAMTSAWITATTTKAMCARTNPAAATTDGLVPHDKTRRTNPTIGTTKVNRVATDNCLMATNHSLNELHLYVDYGFDVTTSSV